MPERVKIFETTITLTNQITFDDICDPASWRRFAASKNFTLPEDFELDIIPTLNEGQYQAVGYENPSLGGYDPQQVWLPEPDQTT